MFSINLDTALNNFIYKDIFFFWKRSFSIIRVCLNLYKFIFCLYSTDTVQVFLFVCPTVSDLRFNGCCHPCLTRKECYIKLCMNVYSEIISLLNMVYVSVILFLAFLSINLSFNPFLLRVISLCQLSLLPLPIQLVSLKPKENYP